MNRPAIEALIPHREPFLLLDEIHGDGDELTAKFTLDEKLPLFAQIYAGHYPHNPITPGVILCEIIFQAGAALLAGKIAGGAGGTPVITRIRDARFKRLVKPNETVEIHVALTDQAANAFYLDGKITVGGELAVRVSFTCALIESINN
ncbi:3-hydroxyacyl-[acyl-carrier-protein] dehydratase FabZ [Planctomycetales bacterium]|nr:3-hydroxyacyl-[acyl-carrier-protein] dehydratase FabZ [Planctomycetales bacterium]GHT05235.1 3-hydroxyacyl-[acyl-carrier-protein] dehydratase FabZ [Planctomycetales bacterium]